MPDTCPAIRLAFSARARLRVVRCQGSTPSGVVSASAACFDGFYGHARACGQVLHMPCLPFHPRDPNPAVCLCVRLSVGVSVCLCLYLSVCLSVCLFVCLFVCLSVCLSDRLSIVIYVCISLFCIYVCMYVCMYVYISICVPACKHASMHVGTLDQHANSFPIAQAPSTLHVDASIPESARPPRLTRATHTHTV